MDEQQIEIASEALSDAVAAAVDQLGPDVAMALLIHCLHEITLAKAAQGPTEGAA